MPVGDLALGFRFGVYFFADCRVPNPIDIRFQRVSGLSAAVSLKTYAEGGQNLYAHRFPEAIGYQNLVLERSAPLISPLGDEFSLSLSLFKFSASNAMVTLFDDSGAPTVAWMFLNAYPVKWATSDLDAKENGIIIDKLELAYTRMQIMRP